MQPGTKLPLLSTIFALGFLPLTAAKSGFVERYNHQVQKFVPDPLLSPLQEFKVTTYEYRTVFDDQQESFGTTMYAEYSTANIPALEDYAVVQYIKGCQFMSGMERGKTVKSWSIARKFFGDYIKFIHPRWVVDSIDQDPVYFSSPHQTLRQGRYLWNDGPGYERAGEHLFSNSPPPTPRLYVSDRPGTAFVDENGLRAKNIALDFDVCLIPTSQIPLTLSPQFDLRPRAIKCFQWTSSFVYDFQQRRFTHPQNTNEVCAQ